MSENFYPAAACTIFYPGIPVIGIKLQSLSLFRVPSSPWSLLPQAKSLPLTLSTRVWLVPHDTLFPQTADGVLRGEVDELIEWETILTG